MSNTIQVTCEGMDSFHDVIEALNGRFNPDVNIKLTISYSKLMVSPRSVIFTIILSREYLTDPSSSPMHDHLSRTWSIDRFRKWIWTWNTYGWTMIISGKKTTQHIGSGHCCCCVGSCYYVWDCILYTLSYHLYWATALRNHWSLSVWLYGQIHGLATREEPNKRKYGIERTSSRRLGSTTDECRWFIWPPTQVKALEKSAHDETDRP